MNVLTKPSFILRVAVVIGIVYLVMRDLDKPHRSNIDKLLDAMVLIVCILAIVYPFSLSAGMGDQWKHIYPYFYIPFYIVLGLWIINRMVGHRHHHHH